MPNAADLPGVTEKLYNQTYVRILQYRRPDNHTGGLGRVDLRPYIVMTLAVRKMQASGVEIRVPRGVDAIPSRLVRWSREGVPNERIDQDIPTAALGRLEWRP